MNRTGYIDLPLNSGRVPQWLTERMTKLSGAIIETIVDGYGKKEVLRRLSDPFWFQAFGALLGMEWHSSGITTSVMGALKRAIHPISSAIGIFICGGRERYSKNTPRELLTVADDTGLNGDDLVRFSILSARVDNNAVQDGFQLYQHSFIVTDEGDWAVVQQGINRETGLARRYHWYSSSVRSFVEEPHASIYGENQGVIMNLVDRNAAKARKGIGDLATEKPEKVLKEIRSLVLPSLHNEHRLDVNLKRLVAVLTLAYDRDLHDFESLLLLEGVGSKTVQSLAIMSEIIHGTPIRFSDPARFSFYRDNKGGRPLPVQQTVCDETIEFMKTTVSKAKIGVSERQEALKNLAEAMKGVENSHNPMAYFEEVIRKERIESGPYRDRTGFDESKKRRSKKNKMDDPGRLSFI